MVVTERFLEVLGEIHRERVRQLVSEGWTEQHDDKWRKGELAFAAAAYTLEANSYHPPTGHEDLITSHIWPWDINWWKPKDPRRDLIKAAALIVAEIERIDRAKAKSAAA